MRYECKKDRLVHDDDNDDDFTSTNSI
jgi:hypothetical protein